MTRASRRSRCGVSNSEMKPRSRLRRPFLALVLASLACQPTLGKGIGFDSQRALDHVKHLSSTIGTRFEGSRNEWKAGDYIAEQFRSHGYMVTLQEFPLPDGTTSRNVVACRGDLHRALAKGCLVVGAHYDSKKPESPGANDNASGVGTMLEIARVFADEGLRLPVVFIGFGAEEIIDANKDHHHYGSRYFVLHLSEAAGRNMIGMMTLDMVGVGKKYMIGNMRVADHSLAKLCIQTANELGYAAQYFKSRPWSDHEAFEYAGIPVAYHKWYPDPNYHTRRDTWEKVDKNKMAICGITVIETVRELSRRR